MPDALTSERMDFAGGISMHGLDNNNVQWVLWTRKPPSLTKNGTKLVSYVPQRAKKFGYVERELAARY